MKHKSPEMDEREVGIRTKVFYHGFWILAALLFADFMLGVVGVSWAAGRSGSLVLLGAAWFAMRLGFIIHGVSYGRRWSPKGNVLFLLANFVFIGITLAIVIAIGLNRAQPFAAHGQLTTWACVLLFLTLSALAFLCDIAKILFDLLGKRPRKEEEIT